MNVTLHDKLICPHCAGNDFYQSINKVDLICLKCNTRVKYSSLRVAVEQQKPRNVMTENIRKGYTGRFLVPSVTEQRDALKRIEKMRIRSAALAGATDINKPGIKDELFEL